MLNLNRAWRGSNTNATPLPDVWNDLAKKKIDLNRLKWGNKKLLRKKQKIRVYLTTVPFIKKRPQSAKKIFFQLNRF